MGAPAKQREHCLIHEICAQGYNVGVVAPAKSDAHKAHHHATYASEATGLLLVAFLLLVLTVIRYWHNIQWSWR